MRQYGDARKPEDQAPERDPRRPLEAPRPLNPTSPMGALALQRTVGNRAFRQLLRNRARAAPAGAAPAAVAAPALSPPIAARARGLPSILSVSRRQPPLPPPPPPVVPARYTNVLTVDDTYQQRQYMNLPGERAPEQLSSQPDITAAATNVRANARVVAGTRTFEDAFKANFGWSDADLAMYFQPGGQLKPGADPQVTYMNRDAERRRYEVAIGPQLRWSNGNPFDPAAPDDVVRTDRLFAKASNVGNAIYVMDTAGKLYMASHKIGLFHHSSFLGAGLAAAAGDMKVTNGQVMRITAHSGHYRSGPANLVQLIGELLDRGHPLSATTVQLSIPNPPGPAITTTLGAFVQQHMPARAADLQP